MYLTLFLLMRFIVRREAGSLGVTDLLMIVLIADAAQNGIANDYTSITEGLVVIATIIGARSQATNQFAASSSSTTGEARGDRGQISDRSRRIVVTI
jgi:hypothetical protein